MLQEHPAYFEGVADRRAWVFFLSRYAIGDVRDAYQLGWNDEDAEQKGLGT